MTLRLSRPALDVGIVVNDLNRARLFYETVLGLEVAAEVRTSIVGDGTMIMLRCGFSRVKLLRFDRPAAADEVHHLAGRIGIGYLTLPIDNLSDVLHEAARHDVAVHQPLTDLPRGGQMVMLRDPEGNIVELVTEPRPDPA